MFFSEKVFAIANVLDQAVLVLLLILSVVSVGMILERLFVLRRITNESKKVRARVKMALQANSVEDIEDIAKDPSSIEGRAANYALRHMKDSGSQGMEEIFNAFALTERPELDKRLGFLATVGSNAPYIGLFGTVWGIMSAFQKIGASGSASLAVVAPGISEALIATAIGLAAAIPAVIAYNHFISRLKKAELEIEGFATDFLNISKRNFFKDE